ncbi:MAG TPA: hypothetical protein DF614_05965 [Methylococcaceae bacterium]|nr:hypothetical protein [Methylococcaceae bacterium]
MISSALNLLSFSVIAKESGIHTKKIAPAKPSVLLIGDSHTVGVFGHALTHLLTETLPNVAITTVASCGSDPKWWLEGKPTNCGFWQRRADGVEIEEHKAYTPKLDTLLRSKPKLTLVALGSNIILMNEEERVTYTQALMAMIEKKSSRCIWIGPPDSRKFSVAEIGAVYSLLKTLAKPHHCQVIDSRKYTLYPSIGGDGLHYGGKEGTVIALHWAEKLFSHDIKPILLKSFSHERENKKN